ncbi:hypothetical protein KKG83_07365 [Candidatus Micrarchaeota archaeon]|nr:hypothetical protein [Candidatus Micrarchaeota archaeon]
MSEGKNDTIFLRELLTTRIQIDESKILFFDQNSQDTKKKLKFIEEDYFDKLQSEWLPYNLLVKSESGKTKIIDVTISKLVNLCKQRYDPIMLIDLDGNTIDLFEDKLKKKFMNRFRGANLTLTSCELLQKIDEASVWSIKLCKDDKTIGTIYIIGFHLNLEDVTGIKNNFHTDEEKKVIVNNYIKNSHIDKIFKKAL